MTGCRDANRSSTDVATGENWRPKQPIPDFGLLSPEINSANMYSGAGSRPLIAAADAWDALALELDSYTAGCSMVLANLQHESWQGSAATAMFDAVTRYLAWAATAAERVADAADKARAAATAYEAAFRAVVPPEKITTNRAHAATLIRGNLLGQNSPAIAAAESAYAEMWAQDAAAMYDYAASSSEAATLMPFGSPPTIACAATHLDDGPDRMGPTTAAAPGQSRQAPPRVQSAARPRVRDPAAGTTRQSVFSDRLQQWESLVNACADLNTVLIAPLQLFYALAETAFDTGNYAYTVKAGFSTNPVGTAPPKTAGPVGAEPSRSASPSAHNPLLDVEYPPAPVRGLAVPPGWVAATPSGGAAEPPTRGDPRTPPGWGAPRPGIPPSLPTSGVAAMNPAEERRGRNAVFRRRDRRFKMPRPAVGG